MGFFSEANGSAEKPEAHGRRTRPHRAGRLRAKSLGAVPSGSRGARAGGGRAEWRIARPDVVELPRASSGARGDCGAESSGSCERPKRRVAEARRAPDAACASTTVM